MALSFSIENILRRTPSKRKLEAMLDTEECVETRFTSIDRMSGLTRVSETAELSLTPPPFKQLVLAGAVEGVVAELEDGENGLCCPAATSTPSPPLSLPSPTSSRSSSPSSQRESSSPSLSAEDDVEDNASGPQRQKKARTSFTQAQINQLEARYRSQRYLGAEERKVIAEELGLKNLQVKTWFQNRRMKEKRQIRDSERRDPFSSMMPTNNLQVQSHMQPILLPGPLTVATQSHPFDLPNHDRRFIDVMRQPSNQVHQYGYPASRHVSAVSSFPFDTRAHGLLTIGQASLSHVQPSFSHLAPVVNAPLYQRMAMA